MNRIIQLVATVCEGRIILLLCVLVTIRVLFFSAAFPFFNIVDEQAHFDLVVRYSEGDVPRSVTAPGNETIPYITIFSTPEYFNTPESQPGGYLPGPSWKQSPAAAKPYLHNMEIFWRNHVKNHEAAQPPLYYSIAGIWWRVGKLFRLDGGDILYWLRCFNAFLLVAIIWLSWRTTQMVFPENRFIHLAVPTIITFMPQTAFYSINNDILVPITFGGVFYLSLKFWEAKIIPPKLAAALGLALAAACLSKTSNLPLLAATGIFLAVKIAKLIKERKLVASLSALLALGLCASLPIVGWAAWCKINFGDFTGAHLKIQYLGWTDKPFFAWFHHPLFTLRGVWFFVEGNLSTFWQGEFLWWHKPLAIPDLDIFYTVLTLIVGLALLITLCCRPTAFTPRQRTAIWFGFACFFAAFAFFALLSVKYDFQTCFYPSQVSPFFVSGRLMLGLLIPFSILFVASIDRLMHDFQDATKFLLLAFFLAFMVVSEITIDLPVFSSEYNWFHM